MGSTDVTVDQGGSGGSDGIQVDGWPMRRVAAEARRVLLDKNPRPTDADIRQAMSRTLCRCMTYYRVQAAIKRAAGGGVA